MILLTTTSDLFRLTTSSTANIDVHASYVDRNGSTKTGGRTNTLISSATTTTIVAAPSSGTVRIIESVTIRNRHATNSNTVTVKHSDGTNIPELISVTLAAGEQLVYDNDEWCVIDAAGGRRIFSQAGLYIGQTILTAGTTFTTGPRTNRIRIRGVGGGGGGGGCTSVAASASAAGGGGAGGYAEKDFVVTPNTAYTYAIGAAGAGASGAGGGNGGNSTFTVGATTVTAGGGTGAVVATAAAALTAYAGGAGGTATNGDINAAGGAGQPGVTLIVATPVVSSGAGGNSNFGGGGVGITAVGNGNNAGTLGGFGGGGGGAATGASTVRTGGNGTAGCWIVEEYT